MSIFDLFKSKKQIKLEEAVHVVEERTQHFRQHINSINERLDAIEVRISKLIQALEKK